MKRLLLAIVFLLPTLVAASSNERKLSTAVYHLGFCMVDSADHTTPKTGLSPTVTLSKNWASFGAASGAVTEVGNGCYKLAANATDVNTLGDLALYATATGADPAWRQYVVTTNDPFTYPDTSSTRARVTLVDTATTITDKAGFSLSTNVWDELTASHVGAGTFGARLDAAISSRSSHSAADVWASATRTLTACSFCLTSAQVATAVWDELLAGHSTAGTAGKALTDAGGVTAAGIWSYSLRTLTSVPISATIVSPVGLGGLLSLIRNDSYTVEDDTAVEVSRTGWPDLTGATEIKLTARSRTSDALWFSVTDVEASRVTAAGGASQTVVFELSETDTLLLVPGDLSGKYDIQATLASGNVKTLVVTAAGSRVGGITVYEDQTRP